jgi:uncharacterized protein YndB with AHSA1/START domain
MSDTETVDVVVEREFPHRPEKLWRALTQPHLIQEWLMQNDFVPQVGHRFTLDAGPKPGWDGQIACEVLVVEPNKTLSYSWGTLGLETAVIFTLTPTDAGTHLRVEQTGFAADRPQNYRGATAGWHGFLKGLDHVLARID